jgi:hypothetical protein
MDENAELRTRLASCEELLNLLEGMACKNESVDLKSFVRELDLAGTLIGLRFCRYSLAGRLREIERILDESGWWDLFETVKILSDPRSPKCRHAEVRSAFEMRMFLSENL